MDSFGVGRVILEGIKFDVHLRFLHQIVLMEHLFKRIVCLGNIREKQASAKYNDLFRPREFMFHLIYNL